MIMTHPGMPSVWVLGVAITVVLVSFWALKVPAPGNINTTQFPPLGHSLRKLTASTWPLLCLKILLVVLFLLVIVAGLKGSPIPERNIATVLTWNWWWAGLVFSVFFLGSAWCAVCPWNTLADWVVRGQRLKLRVPRFLRSLWPALWLLIGLTWLELGVGITSNPYATAILALVMVVLATLSLAVFERKAFCRYFCPVGRTVGFYAQLAPVELRPIDTDICTNCTTLDCYHGTDTVEPCPTHLVMGRLTENTYCTSCGNCTQSCPQQNISWRLRPISREALQTARPHWDEACFILALLALTGFHGLTMLDPWQSWISELGRDIQGSLFRFQDSGQLLLNFSVGMLLATALPVLAYSLCVLWVYRMTRHEHQTAADTGYRQLFSGCAFVALPLAFAYHLAHNLNHLVRENSGTSELLLNPLGTGTQPLSMMEKHQRHLDMWLSQEWLFALQAGLMALGFCIAMQVIRYRGYRLLGLQNFQLFPLLLFAGAITGYHLWLLMQPMTMRM